MTENEDALTFEHQEFKEDMVMKAWVWVLVLLAGGVGCAPRQSIEFYSDIGVEVQGGSGFYAYRTALPAVPNSEVRLEISTVDSLRGTRILQEFDGLEWNRRRHISFVRPDQLTAHFAQAGFSSVDALDDRDCYVLGTILKPMRIPLPGLSQLGNRDETGIQWLDAPSRRLEMELKHTLEQLVPLAAEYGANAIVDLRLQLNSKSSAEYVATTDGGYTWFLRGSVVRVKVP